MSMYPAPKRKRRTVLLVSFLVIASFLIGVVSVIDLRLVGAKLPFPQAQAQAQSHTQTEQNTGPFGEWVKVNPASVLYVQFVDAGNGRVTGTLMRVTCSAVDATNLYNTETYRLTGVSSGDTVQFQYTDERYSVINELTAQVSEGTLKINLPDIANSWGGAYTRGSISIFNQDVQALKATGC